MIAIQNYEGEVHGKTTRCMELKSATDQVCVTNYGARVVSWHTADKMGQQRDIVCGFDSIDDYLHAHEVYHGATIGRYANRIRGAAFTIGDKRYTLDANHGEHILHGGHQGIHQQVWDVLDHSSHHVVMRVVSPAGASGFPGEITTTVTYQLLESHLSITYHAETTQTTVLSMTHHSFFNLNGHGAGTILDHSVHIDAEHYTPIDAEGIPVGTVRLVYDTPLDFTVAKTIGRDIDVENTQLQYGSGYDHNYVVNAYYPGEVKYLARAMSKASGIALECWSDKPGMQFYTGNHLDGRDLGKDGVSYTRRSAFCFEPQFFPDSPNWPDFPSTLLRVGESYHSCTMYRCSVVANV